VIMARRIWTLLLIGIAGCASQPTRLEVTELAAGEWTVAALTNRGAILRKTRDIQPRATRAAAALPEFALAADPPTPLPVDTFTAFAGTTPIQIARIAGGLHYASLSGQTPLIRSPADSQVYAVELPDGIWAFNTPNEMRKLTLDEGRSELEARQREGVVILYWAASPVWSADGKFIAFVTNREAVRAGTPGQSIWFLDAYTGVQGPLFAEARISVYTAAAFGDEFLYIDDSRHGVYAVHPRTRATRRVSDGYVLASHARGRAVLLKDDATVMLWRSTGVDTLASPGAGFVWSTQAATSPSGDRVALLSTDEEGAYRLHVVVDGDTLPSYSLPAPPSHGPAWTSDDALIISLQYRDGLRTHQVRLR
jgi:hypothetical protein